MSSRVVVGAGRRIVGNHERQRTESHTRTPWVSQPYEWLAQPDQQGRDGWRWVRRLWPRRGATADVYSEAINPGLW